MSNLNKIIEDLSKLTVVEAAELSKQLEEKWGVTAAAPVAAAAPTSGGAAPEEEKSEFSDDLPAFLISLKHKSGGFHLHKDGELDVRGVYCALSSASLMNVTSKELFKNTSTNLSADSSPNFRFNFFLKVKAAIRCLDFLLLMLNLLVFLMETLHSC